MAIWHPDSTTDLERLNSVNETTMMGALGIEISEVGDDYIRATMPVDQRTRQPYGILHGGANVTLAETLGSLGAGLCMDPGKYAALGVDINANHLRPVSSGTVTGTARPLHIGRRTQVWEIRIENEAGKLSCISRFTVTNVPLSELNEPVSRLQR